MTVQDNQSLAMEISSKYQFEPWDEYISKNNPLTIDLFDVCIKRYIKRSQETNISLDIKKYHAAAASLELIKIEFLSDRIKKLSIIKLLTILQEETANLNKCIDNLFVK